jgi:ADP-ribose pyrophosphatase
MRKILFEGKFLHLLDEDSWEFADRPASAGIVSVVALDGENLLLVEQFRHAQQAPVVSLPGGLIDRPAAGQRQESPVEAGRRELREETGYEAGRIAELITGPISPGMTTETVTFVLAQELVLAGPQMLDAHENISMHRVPLLQLSDWLRDKSARGSKIDLKVFVALYFLGRRGA